MFTGIITHLGKVESIYNSKYTFSADSSFFKQVRGGSSVSVNGVCLTVISNPKSNRFTVEVMPETARKTMLVNLAIGDMVNLELPATYKTFLSGHIVQGHVDGVGTSIEIIKEENSRILTIGIDKELTSYIVEKGSISVNGISLTVISIGESYFTVGIIPYTWKHTMLYTIRIGDRVNIEVDIIAKYVEKLLRVVKGEKK